MKKRSLPRDFPLFALTIVSLISLIDNIIDIEKVLLLQHYLGIGSVLLSLIIYVVNYRLYKYFFTIILFMGVFSIIYFSNPVFSISFSFEFLEKYEANTLRIQSIAIIVMILQVLLNRKEYWRKFEELIDNLV